MWRKSCLATLLVAILCCQAQAAVMRIDSGSNVAVQKAESSTSGTITIAEQVTDATTPNTKEEPEPEATTLKILVADEHVPLVPLSRDEDASIQIGSGLIDPPTDTIDEVTHSPQLEFPKASIATIDPAPGTLEALEVVLEEQIADVEPQNSAELNKQIQKSSKLLLLSTPKLTDRPREPEENIEEPEEIVGQETTDRVEDSTTIETVSMSTTQQSVTKLKAVNEPQQAVKSKEQEQKKDTEQQKPKANDDSKESEESDETVASEKSKNNEKCDESKATDNSVESKEATQAQQDSKSKEDSKKAAELKQSEMLNCEKSKEAKEAADLKSNEDAKQSDDDAPKSDDTTAIATELAAQPLNDNAATSVLLETEAEYVLFDTDFDEEYGSFTHIDSDVHLQPIVQSVEIVPTSVDGDLIVNYVHSW